MNMEVDLSHDDQDVYENNSFLDVFFIKSDSESSFFQL